MSVPDTILQLPEHLTRIGENAFAGIAANALVIPSGLEELSGLPTDMLWYCHSGSSALTYAQEHGINYIEVP